MLIWLFCVGATIGRRLTGSAPKEAPTFLGVSGQLAGVMLPFFAFVTLDALNLCFCESILLYAACFEMWFALCILSGSTAQMQENYPGGAHEDPPKYVFEGVDIPDQ